MIEQTSPELDHAANGLAKVGVREVTAQTRVLKSHVAKRLKRQLDWSEPLATWLVRHSANYLSRYRIQADGKTPDQRRTGKRWRRQAVEFGEKASIPIGRGTSRRTRGRRCGENDGWHFRWSSWAHWRVIVPLKAWIVERHETSAENRRQTVGQRIHPKVSRSSVDAHWRRA